jgi:hypothetical protein
MALPHRAGSFAVNFGEHAVRRIAFGWESKHGVCRVAIGGGHSGVFAFQAAPAPSDATEYAQRLGLR